MSLTVRLRGLPPNADSIHVRNFLCGLKIPTGGVKIVGGEDGEAFVSFQKRVCVDLALKRSGKHLMGFPVHISVADLQQNSNGQETKPQYEPGYLRISFTPLDAKFYQVKRFFKGLSVESVIFLSVNKVRTGYAYVKFGKIYDARKIVWSFQLPKNSSKGHKKQNGFSVLSVKRARQKEWINCGGKIGPGESKQVGSFSKLLPEVSSNDRHLMYIREFYAHLLNVSLRAEKSHIRKFFHNLVDDSQITFLYDKNGSRQRECFVMFVTESDYVRALELDKAVLKGRSLRVLPISKEKMMESIERTGEVVIRNPVSEGEEEEMEPEVKYFYLRNFAASVNKPDVLNFFTGFSLTEKDICLLYDDNGDSLGEALVRLSTEEASRAETLNHKRFQDTEILLRCISEEQLKVFGVDCFLDRSTA